MNCRAKMALRLMGKMPMLRLAIFSHTLFVQVTDHGEHVRNVGRCLAGCGISLSRRY